MQANKKLKGTVLWWNRLAGSGALRDDETRIIHQIFACNIIGAKTAYPHTACVYLEEGHQVTYELIPDCESCGACRVSGGILDKDQWDKIKNKNLAFQLDDKGNFKNGLF